MIWESSHLLAGSANFGVLHAIPVVAVSPRFTTQDCSSCGERVKETLSMRTHICPGCGLFWIETTTRLSHSRTGPPYRRAGGNGHSSECERFWTDTRWRAQAIALR